MKLFSALILFILASCINYQDNSDNLIGKWQCYHREFEDGTTTGIDLGGKEFEYSCDEITIELKSDLTGFDNTGLKFRYQKKDSILTLGNRSYIIEELTNKELIIRDYDPSGISTRFFRSKFKKSNE